VPSAGSQAVGPRCGSPVRGKTRAESTQVAGSCRTIFCDCDVGMSVYKTILSGQAIMSRSNTEVSFLRPLTPRRMPRRPCVMKPQLNCAASIATVPWHSKTHVDSPVQRLSATCPQIPAFQYRSLSTNHIFRI
jgi:hypothetical protein